LKQRGKTFQHSLREMVKQAIRLKKDGGEVKGERKNLESKIETWK